MYKPSDKTVITRLRVRGARLDPLTTQLYTGSLFNNLSLHPAGLPSSAILCIRSLRDPKPGLLPLERSDTRRSLEWEHAVTTQIEQLAREAARPIEGAVPANAQAVVFRDRSEFLACLAVDGCAGDLATHWWWQSLLQGRDVSRAILDSWLETPEHIPLALQWLENKRLSADFLQRLTDNDVETIMTVLVQTFALHNLLPLIHQGTLNLSTQIPDVETQPRTYIAENGLKPNMLLDAPWERWIQNSSINQLTPDRQFFLGVGLMLLNAPSVVRTGSFARQVQGWQIAVIDLQTHVLISETPGRVVKQRKVSRQHSSAHDIQPTEIVNSHTPPVDAAYEVESTSASNPITSREERLGLNLTNLEPRETSRAKDAAFTAKVETFPSNIPEISGSELRSALTDTAAVTHVDLTEIDKEQSTIIETVPLVEMDQNPILERNEHPSLMHREMETLLENVESIEIEIESQFGPVFYFINLGLHLELYGDFTTPLQPGIELPIWDFVALVAQQVLGDQVVHDPVWSLLTRLAGRREEDPPGLYFDPPGHESLESWLEEFMFSVHPRLQSALGVNKEELPSSFMQPARILVTTTHLDVYFSLADLPIEIRLSGLDRDPGWVPAAGKFIGFHYE